MNDESPIGRFKEVLSWMTQRGDKHYEEWSEYGSTKTCSSCGQERSESLVPEVRAWQCAHCQSPHLGEENAALNGLFRVVAQLKLPCLACHERACVTASLTIWRSRDRRFFSPRDYRQCYNTSYEQARQEIKLGE